MILILAVDNDSICAMPQVTPVVHYILEMLGPNGFCDFATVEQAHGSLSDDGNGLDGRVRSSRLGRDTRLLMIATLRRGTAMLRAG